MADWTAHADANDYRNHLMPRMLAMLGDVAGKAFSISAGGKGGYIREVPRRGAQVTVVDASAWLTEVPRA